MFGSIKIFFTTHEILQKRAKYQYCSAEMLCHINIIVKLARAKNGYFCNSAVFFAVGDVPSRRPRAVFYLTSLKSPAAIWRQLQWSDTRHGPTVGSAASPHCQGLSCGHLGINYSYHADARISTAAPCPIWACTHARVGLLSASSHGS